MIEINLNSSLFHLAEAYAILLGLIYRSEVYSEALCMISIWTEREYEYHFPRLMDSYLVPLNDKA